jgi:hypothetical protein
MEETFEKVTCELLVVGGGSSGGGGGGGADEAGSGDGASWTDVASMSADGEQSNFIKSHYQKSLSPLGHEARRMLYY